MEKPCPKCGNRYKNLGQHWEMSSKCSHPSFTQHQKEVITGLMMGDATIDRGNKNPLIKCEMVSPNYLEHIDNVFGPIGTYVSLSHTAEESAKRSRDSGFDPNARGQNYSDVYIWRSRTHPDLQQWANWYSTGEKVWPKDIELTPTVLKHWYCGDGCWSNSGTKNHMKISTDNEAKNVEKINSIFENSNLPSNLTYNINKRKNNDNTLKCDIEFTVEQSKELWEYMGEPLPDFEYKWPNEFQ